MLAIRDDKKTSVTATFYLEMEDGAVRLNAKDADGDTWYIATITDQGIVLHNALPRTLGIKYDKGGRILVTEE